MLELPAELPHDVPGLWQGHRDWLAQQGIREPRVTLHGGYGKNNLGDDAILHVLIQRVLSELPGAQLVIVCHGPENVARRYAHVNGLTACGFKSRAALRAMFLSHIYIIGGGGIINRINAYSGRQTLRLLDMKGKFLFLAALAARLSGAQTHFYAIGANSFPDAGVRFLARHVLETANVVSVRDQGSLGILRDLGLERRLVPVLDPALSMRPAAPGQAAALLQRWGYQGSTRPLVLIGFRYVREANSSDENKIAAVTRLARHLMDQRSADVVFFPASQHPSQHAEDDLDFGRAVLRELKGHPQFFLVEEYPHPELAMAVFGRANLCIFERLHAVILSSLMDVPVFAIAYDEKVSEYVKLIGQTRDCMTSQQFVETHDHAWLDRPFAAAMTRAKSHSAAE
jgi:polysaccharide pyruvyl transferase WcaK-like protein